MCVGEIKQEERKLLLTLEILGGGGAVQKPPPSPRAQKEPKIAGPLKNEVATETTGLKCSARSKTKLHWGCCNEPGKSSRGEGPVGGPVGISYMTIRPVAKEAHGKQPVHFDQPEKVTATKLYRVYINKHI